MSTERRYGSSLRKRLERIIGWFYYVLRNAALDLHVFGFRRPDFSLDALSIAVGAYIGAPVGLVLVLSSMEFGIGFRIVAAILFAYLIAGSLFDQWIEKGAADTSEIQGYGITALWGLFAGGLLGSFTYFL